jgi:hypothetical protein
MKCRTVRKELLQFVDGELSGERRNTLEHHLRECEACAAEAPQQPALRSAKYSGSVAEQSGSGHSGPGSPASEDVAPAEEAPKNSGSAPNELRREEVDFAAGAEEGPAGGIILLLGEARDVPPSSSCYLEIVFPDGARTVMDQRVERDASGNPRTVQIAYENTGFGTTVP